MTYTIFIDKEQLEFMGNLSQGQNRILENALERMGRQNNNLYYAEFKGMDFFELVLEVKALDKTTCLFNRLVELGKLQDARFCIDFERYGQLKSQAKRM